MNSHVNVGEAREKEAEGDYISFLPNLALIVECNLANGVCVFHSITDIKKISKTMKIFQQVNYISKLFHSPHPVQINPVYTL